MKRLKINLAVAAMIIATAGTFAFKNPSPKATSVLYQRISLNTDSEEWAIATSSSCTSAPDLMCKAYFSYDPNGQTKEYNEANVDLIETDNGYVQ
ncbi:MAG: DUF6520 family protein [Daejeonella sp.]